METLFNSEKPHFSAWLRIYCEDPLPRFGTSQLSSYDLKRGLPLRHVKIPPVYANPLYYSALYGFHNLVEQLTFKDPQHVNSIGGEHDSPLLAALWGKHVRVAEFLLEHGANIDVQGSEKQTPLHKVIRWSDDVVFDTMRFLLKHGADLNARRDDLYSYIWQQIWDVARLLRCYLCTRQTSILGTGYAKLRCTWCRLCLTTIALFSGSGLRSYY